MVDDALEHAQRLGSAGDEGAGHRIIHPQRVSLAGGRARSADRLETDVVEGGGVEQGRAEVKPAVHLSAEGRGLGAVQAALGIELAGRVPSAGVGAVEALDLGVEEERGEGVTPEPAGCPRLALGEVVFEEGGKLLGFALGAVHLVAEHVGRGDEGTAEIGIGNAERERGGADAEHRVHID